MKSQVSNVSISCFLLLCFCMQTTGQASYDGFGQNPDGGLPGGSPNGKPEGSPGWYPGQFGVPGKWGNIGQWGSLGTPLSPGGWGSPAFKQKDYSIGNPEDSAGGVAGISQVGLGAKGDFEGAVETRGEIGGSDEYASASIGGVIGVGSSNAHESFLTGRTDTGAGGTSKADGTAGDGGVGSMTELQGGVNLKNAGNINLGIGINGKNAEGTEQGGANAGIKAGFKSNTAVWGGAVAGVGAGGSGPTVKPPLAMG